MGKKYNFDYIIIGSGPAGSTTATILAQSSKKRVAIVEARAFGGSNINSRDIPYLVSLDFSHNFFKFNKYPETYGQELHYNFPTIVAHQNSTILALSKSTREKLEAAGITCIEGRAHFLNSHTIAVNEVQYTSENFILATGSKLRTSDIFGLDSVNYLTPNLAIRVRRLPKHILIIGGGPTGCEIASYYAELGSKVIIMEQSDRLLPKEDEEVSNCISEYFAHELGILAVLNAKVVALERDELGKKVVFSNGREEKIVHIENVVLATGSVPYSDFGLGNAGVKIKRDGSIFVNDFFQTTAKNIYAVGDCIGGSSSTERAEYQASLLASNLLKRTKNLANYRGFMRVTNTHPEVATVGLTEVKLKKLKRKYKKSVVYLKDLPTSKINRQDYGFVKLLADHNKHIIGATVVAPNASLIAQELAFIIRHQLSTLEIASTPHLSNSANIAIKLAAKELIK